MDEVAHAGHPRPVPVAAHRVAIVVAAPRVAVDAVLRLGGVQQDLEGRDGVELGGLLVYLACERKGDSSYSLLLGVRFIIIYYHRCIVMYIAFTIHT